MHAVKSQRVIGFRTALSDDRLGLFWKKLHLEEAMNNSSYYKVAEYLKPWESSKSYFLSLSTKSRMHFRPKFSSFHFRNQCRHHAVAQFWLTPSGTVPLWWRAPAPADPPSFVRPASRGGSCSDSGGQTQSPAGLEEHKGQRSKTSHNPWKRIIAKGDAVACYKGWVWKLHYQPGDRSQVIRSMISFKNMCWCVVASISLREASVSECWRTLHN